MKRRSVILHIFLFAGWLPLQAQYAPGVGKPGTTALYKDSSAFVAWATSAEVFPGPVKIGDDSLGIADVGTSASAIGKSGSNGVVSLGDGGSILLQFASPIFNGEGWDFAVFENSFDGLFLELAFVEVSSDGERYVRFPSTSLTDTNQVFTGFDTLYPENLNNLAGKYPLFYGTPFDLEELKDSVGLDINKITHVRVVDVIGTADPAWCSRDASGRIIRDPWPTPFPSGGFDLDAVGVIHQIASSSLLPNRQTAKLHIWPQPANNELWIELPERQEGIFRIFSISGTLLRQIPFQRNTGTPLSIRELQLPAGLYLLDLEFRDGKTFRDKFIVSS